VHGPLSAARVVRPRAPSAARADGAGEPPVEDEDDPVSAPLSPRAPYTLTPARTQFEAMAHLPSVYTLRRPIVGGMFNTRDYAPGGLAPGGLAPAALLADLEALERAGTDALQILPAHLPAHAAVLLVPDFWDRGLATARARLLLVSVSVTCLCVMQARGAGACMREVGADHVHTRSCLRQRTGSGA
jgi:hypothetical protein